MLIRTRYDGPREAASRGPAETVRVDGLAAANPRLVRKPQLEVRNILAALETLGTIQRPAKGLYRYGPPTHQDQPSTRFAAQIAALCAPSMKGSTHD